MLYRYPELGGLLAASPTFSVAPDGQPYMLSTHAVIGALSQRMGSQAGGQLLIITGGQTCNELVQLRLLKMRLGLDSALKVQMLAMLVSSL